MGEGPGRRGMIREGPDHRKGKEQTFALENRGDRLSI
jgi:hypothetical protein